MGLEERTRLGGRGRYLRSDVWQAEGSQPLCSTPSPPHLAFPVQAQLSREGCFSFLQRSSWLAAGCNRRWAAGLGGRDVLCFLPASAALSCSGLASARAPDPGSLAHPVILTSLMLAQEAGGQQSSWYTFSALHPQV